MSTTPNAAPDQGTDFGTWPDAVSHFMYRDIMPSMLEGVDTSGQIADFGGGNGLLKEWIPNSISIDSDAAKGPDVVGDVLTHRGTYDLVVMRYLLHYLNDEQVHQLFANLFKNGCHNLLLIQFANDAEDLDIKRQNSALSNEGEKHFRSTEGLNTLIFSALQNAAGDTAQWHIDRPPPSRYMVGAEFYQNRLDIEGAVPHRESIYRFYIRLAHRTGYF